jgi:hypothetical protein
MHRTPEASSGHSTLLCDRLHGDDIDRQYLSKKRNKWGIR